MLTDTALCNLKSKPKPYKASDQAVDIFVALHTCAAYGLFSS